MGAVIVAMSLGLAACSSGTSTASRTTSKTSAGKSSGASSPTSTTSTSSTSASATPVLKGGSSPHSAFCTNLAVENAAEAKLSKGLDAATKSNNLAIVQKAFGSFLTSTQKELAKVTGSATSAPANVKTAFATVTSFYAQLKSTVAHATSIKQIQSAIAGLTQTPAIAGAGSTISAYVTEQCGSSTTPST